jgi:hypothetical protein
MGITPFYSASNPLQNHVIGVRDDYSNGQSDLQFSKIGTNGPRDDKWRD